MLTVAQASTALQQSLDQWNNIPTSFIDMKIVGTVANAGLVGFDMVNELSFRTAAALRRHRVVTLHGADCGFDARQR